MTTTLVVSAGGVSLAARVFNTAALKSIMIPGCFISGSTHSHKDGHSEPAAAVAGHTTSGRKGISEQVRAVPLKNWDCCCPEERKSCRRRFDRWRRLHRQDGGGRRRQSLDFILGVRAGENGYASIVGWLRAARGGRTMLGVTASATATRPRTSRVWGGAGGHRENTVRCQNKSQQENNGCLHWSQ